MCSDARFAKDKFPVIPDARSTFRIQIGMSDVWRFWIPGSPLRDDPE
jgi:hypothetical protein